MTQLLEQAPAGFLPRVFYGLTRGAQTYRFVQDYVFNVVGLSGNVGDAYELFSTIEPGNDYIAAVAVQINEDQLKIVIKGDYTQNTTTFLATNNTTGAQQTITVTGALALQDASYLGDYPAADNREKQITVLNNLENNSKNVVFASIDYNSDEVYNWVEIGGYLNGKDGAAFYSVNSATYATISAMLKVNDSICAAESFSTFNIGDVYSVDSIDPLTLSQKGNIRGAQGVQGLPGQNGTNGENGKTPYIQDGYWYIDGTNTGVRALGIDGTNGQDGQSFLTQSGLYSVPANWGQTGNVDPDGNALLQLPTLPQSNISSKGFVVYDPLTTPLEPYYDYYFANNGDVAWTILHPFSGIKGRDGTDGSTPYIQNGYWYINGSNTGVPAQGATGATGATPNITPAATVDANTGTPAVTVVKTGTNENPTFTFNFSNLKGAKGDTGNTGATGATPNISVSATTLPAGSQATATRSGTDANPIITFGIPKGADGSMPQWTVLYDKDSADSSINFGLTSGLSGKSSYGPGSNASDGRELLLANIDMSIYKQLRFTFLTTSQGTERQRNVVDISPDDLSWTSGSDQWVLGTLSYLFSSNGSINRVYGRTITLKNSSNEGWALFTISVAKMVAYSSSKWNAPANVTSDNEFMITKIEAI